MKRASHNRLDARNRFLLTQRTQLEYPDAGLDDVRFAKKMTADLGFPVTGSQIAGIRRAFEIPSSIKRGDGVNRASTIKRLDALTLRVEELESHLAVLLRERAQHHPVVK